MTDLNSASAGVYSVDADEGVGYDWIRIAGDTPDRIYRSLIAANISAEIPATAAEGYTQVTARLNRASSSTVAKSSYQVTKPSQTPTLQSL